MRANVFSQLLQTCVTLFQGLLVSYVDKDMIKAANEAVTTVTKATLKQKSRGYYKKFTAEQQATVAQYAVMHGNAAAIRHFLEDLGEIRRAHFGLKGRLCFV